MGYEKFEVSGVSAAPRPFPGKYPTRVIISSIRGEVPFRYEGKPKGLLELVYKQFLKKKGRLDNLRFTEFDQNGIVFSLTGGLIGSQVTFVPFYMPAFTLMGYDLTRLCRMYFAMDRVLERVRDKWMYSNKFWDLLEVPTSRALMMDDCSRGRFRQRWFPTDLTNKLCYDILPALVAKWQVAIAPTRVVPEPPRRRIILRDTAPPPPKLPTAAIPPPAPTQGQPQVWFNEAQVRDFAMHLQQANNLNAQLDDTLTRWQ